MEQMEAEDYRLLLLNQWMAFMQLWHGHELASWLEELVEKEMDLEEQYLARIESLGGRREDLYFRLDLEYGVGEILNGDPECGMGTARRHNNLFVERCRGLGLEAWFPEAPLLEPLIQQELQLEAEYVELWDAIPKKYFYNSDGMYQSEYAHWNWGEAFLDCKQSEEWEGVNTVPLPTPGDGECLPLEHAVTVSGPSHQPQEPETQWNVPWVGSDNPCLPPDTPRDLIPEEVGTAHKLGPDKLSLPSEVLGKVCWPELLMEPEALDYYVMDGGKGALEARLEGNDEIPQPASDNHCLYPDSPGELSPEVLVKHRAQEGCVRDCGEGKELVSGYREPDLTQQESARGTKSQAGAASMPALAKALWVQSGTMKEGVQSGEIPWITIVQGPTGTDTTPKTQFNRKDWDKVAQPRAMEECKHSLGGSSVAPQAATETAGPEEESQEERSLCNTIGPETVLEIPAHRWGLAGGNRVAMGQKLWPTCCTLGYQIIGEVPWTIWVGVNGKSNLLYTVGARPRAGGGFYSAPWDRQELA